MAGDDAEPLVQVAAQGDDLVSLLVNRRARPRRGARAGHREQGDGGAQGHAACHRVVEERRVRAQRRAQRSLRGDEEDHQLGRGTEGARVVARSERLHVGTQGLRVRGELRAAPSLRILAAVVDAAGPQVGVHGGFRVEGEETLTRQVDRHVGAPAVSRCADRAQALSLSERSDRALLREVDVRHHAGCFEDAGELDLAPRAARATRAQGSLQGGGRAGQVRLALGGVAQLLGECPVLACPRLFHLVDARRHLLQLRANRGECLQHGGVPLGAGLGGFDATGQLLGARLPPCGLRAQRARVIPGARRAARHRPHVPEQSAHDQSNQEKNKRHTHSATIRGAMYICVPHACRVGVQQPTASQISRLC